MVEVISVREVRLAGILAPSDPLAWEGPRLGPTELPPPDTEVAAQIRAELPPRYQRPPHR